MGQAAVQALGFIGGILVIRMLPVHEYALYTLANTMLGTMTVLADAGVATGVMAEGGRVWRDRHELGTALATGMALRRKLATLSLMVAVPALLYLLHRQDASWLMSGLIVLSLIPAYFSTLSGKLLEIPVALHQEVRPLQRIQVQSGFVRLALLGAFTFVFPLAAVAIACGGAGQLWSNLRVRRLSNRHAESSAPPRADVRQRILAKVRSLLPLAIYYCVSGQLVVWIISLFGSTEALAQIGALARLAAVLSIIQAVVGMIAVPRFVRLDSHHLKPVLMRFIQIEISVAAVCVVVVGGVALWPELPLAVLGHPYRGLSTGVVLTMASGCVQLLSSITHHLLSGRGLIVPARVLIPASILFQILFASLFRPNDVVSALWFHLCSTSAVYLLRMVHLSWHLIHHRTLHKA